MTAENLPDATGASYPKEIPCPADPCPDQKMPVTQDAGVGASTCGDQDTIDIQRSDVAAPPNGSHTPNQASAAVRRILQDELTKQLVLCAAFLDDIERVRTAAVERLRSAAREEAETRPGITVPKGANDRALIAMVRQDLPQLRSYADLAEAMLRIEHQATLALQRVIREHPLGPFIKRNVGLGEKQCARLIAAIGDVTYNKKDDRPRRGAGELWAYCGYAPGQRRIAGVVSNFDAQAKMRAHLVAKSAVQSGVRKLDECDDSNGYDIEHRKARSPLGLVYLNARANWADRETTDLHKHNHALRLVAKEILKDLFYEARATLEGTTRT